MSTINAWLEKRFGSPEGMAGLSGALVAYWSGSIIIGVSVICGLLAIIQAIDRAKKS